MDALHLLSRLNNLHVRITEAFTEAANETTATGKKSRVTIVVDFEHPKDTAQTLVVARDEITVKLPNRRTPTSAMLYAFDGEMLERDPHQDPLPGFVREVPMPVTEIREPAASDQQAREVNS